MLTKVETESLQFVLPGMQNTLGIRNVETIPASHVENLTETERLFTANDVLRVIIE